MGEDIIKVVICLAAVLCCGGIISGIVIGAGSWVTVPTRNYGLELDTWTKEIKPDILQPGFRNIGYFSKVLMFFDGSI